MLKPFGSPRLDLEWVRLVPVPQMVPYIMQRERERVAAPLPNVRELVAQ